MRGPAALARRIPEKASAQDPTPVSTPTPEPPSQTAPLAPASKPSKSSKRALVEDLIVSAFGMASSAAVAYGSFAATTYWGFTLYSFMANLIIPVGAIGCGFVAAIGYLIGARLFHHRPTRMLLCNIVLVSLTTFFAIHHLDYTHARVHGVLIEDRISFPDYLVAVTENMRYEPTGAGSHDSPTELGKLGWGVAALQILGFCLGGFCIYGWLKSIPYCDHCAMYFKKVWHRVTKWKDIPAMKAAFQSMGELMQEGQLQEAANKHAVLSDKRFGATGLLKMDLTKCPGCENRRFRLQAQQQRGNKYTKLGELVIKTESPVEKAATPA